MRPSRVLWALGLESKKGQRAELQGIEVGLRGPRCTHRRPASTLSAEQEGGLRWKGIRWKGSRALWEGHLGD